MSVNAKKPNDHHLLLCPVILGAQGGRGGFSLAHILNAEAGAQQDGRREAAVRSGRLPHTIVRAGRVRDAPGGSQRLVFSQEPEKPLGDISRVDLARVLVACLDRQPTHSLTFSVEGGPPGSPPDDLAEDLNRLREVVTEGLI